MQISLPVEDEDVSATTPFSRARAAGRHASLLQRPSAQALLAVEVAISERSGADQLP